MKFGEQLKREAISEWQSMYIDYNALKILLKQVPYSQRPKSHPDPSLCIVNYSPLSLKEQNFLSQLEKELAKVDEFYSTKEEEFRESKRILQFVLSDDSGNTSRKRIEQLRRAYLEMYRGLLLLGAYRRLNKIGFRKIVKKFDKVNTLVVLYYARLLIGHMPLHSWRPLANTESFLLDHY